MSNAMTAATQGVPCGCGCSGAGASCCCSGSACPPLCAPQRPRYFDGQLLTQAELTSEQTYVLEKNRLHNRYLHGWGVVCGLRVSCCDDTRVTVEAGYALDPCGNDIVLPQAQTIPLVQMIQDCRSQAKPSTECNPFVASTLQDCTGADQTWCLTIAYAEQDSRPVAALRGVSSTATGASACGCGCGCNGAAATNGAATGTVSTGPSAMTADTVGRPATACEPTRTTETVSFGVACLPEQQTPTTQTHQTIVSAARQTLADRLPAGTLVGEALQRQAALQLVRDAAPRSLGQNAQDDYTLVCAYLNRIRAALAALPLTSCWIAGDFAQISVRPPNPGEDPQEYDQAVVSPALQQAESLLQAAGREVVCWDLIPGCAPPPPNACVVLACVTLRDDVIIDICMGAPRRQVISFPALQYWISNLPASWLDQLLTFLDPVAFGQAVSGLCCGTRDIKEETVPTIPSAARFYALADMTDAAPPPQEVTGLAPDEYSALRADATTLRTVAVNAFQQLQ